MERTPLPRSVIYPSRSLWHGYGKSLGDYDVADDACAVYSLLGLAFLPPPRCVSGSAHTDGREGGQGSDEDLNEGMPSPFRFPSSFSMDVE